MGGRCHTSSRRDYSRTYHHADANSGQPTLEKSMMHGLFNLCVPLCACVCVCVLIVLLANLIYVHVSDVDIFALCHLDDDTSLSTFRIYISLMISSPMVPDSAKIQKYTKKTILFG